MWRQAANVSYLQYANEMGSLLRQSLKEPHRAKALKSVQVFYKDRSWANGLEVAKTEVTSMEQAFKGVGADAVKK